MRKECGWQAHSWPLKGLCLYYALPELRQATGFAGGFDLGVSEKRKTTKKTRKGPKSEGDRRRKKEGRKVCRYELTDQKAK